MEEIAHAAGVAKPTLYAHFGGKDALFVAACEALGSAMIADASAAAAGEGSLGDRVFGVLSAKFARVFALLSSSPHAQELLHPSSADARASIGATEERLEAILAELLAGARMKGSLPSGKPPAPELARCLMQIGHGAGYGAATLEEHQANLRALVDLVLA